MFYDQSTAKRQSFSLGTLPTCSINTAFFLFFFEEKIGVDYKNTWHTANKQHVLQSQLLTASLVVHPLN